MNCHTVAGIYYFDIEVFTIPQPRTRGWGVFGSLALTLPVAPVVWSGIVIVLALLLLYVPGVFPEVFPNCQMLQQVQQ
jgi:hypothetical protein